MSRRFRQWVDAHQDQAWTLARYLLQDPAEAEDVCQEAFIKLWHHRDRIDPDKVKPWLMKVTRNGCLDRLRRRRPGEELNEAHQVGAVPGPLEDSRQQELGQWLRRAIGGLREPYRSLGSRRRPADPGWVSAAKRAAPEGSSARCMPSSEAAFRRRREQGSETPLVLRDIHQLSYEEVGAALELSLAQVRVYLHRARKQLREHLAEVRP